MSKSLDRIFENFNSVDDVMKNFQNTESAIKSLGAIPSPGTLAVKRQTEIVNVLIEMNENNKRFVEFTLKATRKATKISIVGCVFGAVAALASVASLALYLLPLLS